ncbi:MAG: hypothetical protein OXU66_01170 [Gammaproteobacteria bacterium]|nr:hypothetical protein [Gammaproteobacteria bacterium]MDD9957525.1 hypothetical protein [Gammaproteobacteria bacterium]
MIAEIALGLAGFSAVLVGLSRNTGKIEPPEQFRIMALIYGSMGAVFFALLPFVVFTKEANQGIAWTICGLLLSIYAIAGLLVLPRRSSNLRKTYPDLFPIRLILLQSTLHTGCCICALIGLFKLTAYLANFYNASLLILLLHSTIAFIRTLFFRRTQQQG